MMKLLLSAGLALLCAGCFYPRFLTPDVLEPGQHAAGLGVTAGLGVGEDNPGLAGVDGDLFYRAGVADNVDGGLRAVYSATPPRGPELPNTRSVTFIADARYQAYEDPLAAAGAAIAYTRPLTSTANSLVTVTLGGTAGSRQIYGGLGLVLETEIDPDLGLVTRGPAPYLTAGAALGRRLQVLPQLGLYIDGRSLAASRLALHVGVGAQYIFGTIDYGDDRPGFLH